ncbi:hypothetical protein GmHk_07G019935 [Glycine max]|nr:hypothetical protein GmHk_07G019935 [Glycine max]
MGTAADNDGVDDTVCEKYDISNEKWAQFCQTHRDPSWEDVQKKAQVIQKQNIAPHVLSHGGYEYLEQKLMAEKTKKKLEEASQSGSTEGVINPPSPIRRHVKWKMARTKKTGQMTSEAAKEIAEKIDSFEEQASQGLFVPYGRQDVLTVRAVGASVTIKQYFWIGSTNLPQFLLHPSQRTRAVDSTNQGPARCSPSFNHRCNHRDLHYLRSLRLVPRVFTKGSCGDPSPTDPETGDSDKCGLYIEENSSHLVALGRVYEGSTSVHNIPLLHGQVKVGVEEVKDAEAPIPVPTDEVILVGQALNTFLDWPTHLVKPLSEQSIQRSGQSQFESESYIKSWMQSSKRDVYLGAYLNGSDNYLKGIINSALKGLDDTPQSKSKAGARWIVVKYFNHVKPLEAKRLKVLRIQWAQFYLKVTNQS